VKPSALKTHDSAEKRNPKTIVAIGKQTSRPDSEIVLEEK
jgi:hypothetical protein